MSPNEQSKIEEVRIAIAEFGVRFTSIDEKLGVMAKRLDDMAEDWKQFGAMANIVENSAKIALDVQSRLNDLEKEYGQMWKSQKKIGQHLLLKAVDVLWKVALAVYVAFKVLL